MIQKGIFWFSLFFIFYTYIGYPVILYVWSLFRRQEVKKGDFCPMVSVVISVFNEADYIERKIKNLLSIDYPPEKMEILIVSDGSTDGTAKIVRSCQRSYKNLRFLSFEERRGKASALNLGVSQSKGEIIVFTDARQMFEKDTIKELVGNFSDPTVGAVSGELFLTPEAEHNITMPIYNYWNYEKWIRKMESRIDSVVGVTGAVYAIRRDLFEPIPEEAILDDVYIPMKVVFKGYRVVFDEMAIAYDDAEISLRREQTRKIRTLTGNYQLISLIPELMSPTKNRLFINFFSHKFLRLVAPFFFLAFFISNTLLVEEFYFYILVLQVLFYTIAIAGLYLDKRGVIIKHFSFPYTFFLLNYSAVVGLIYYLSKKDGIWTKSKEQS